jgi:hypothetical protein
MERLGARVCCIEPPVERFWDLVPQHAADLEPRKQRFLRHIERIRNSFWFLHGVYGSRVRCFEADAYQLPETLGRFDVGVLAAVLLHCSSPVRLMESVAKLVGDTLIVTEIYEPALYRGSLPQCTLLPSTKNQKIDTWWNFSPAFITQYLSVLGFPHATVTRHRQFFVPEKRWDEMFTVVARRAT